MTRGDPGAGAGRNHGVLQLKISATKKREQRAQALLPGLDY